MLDELASGVVSAGAPDIERSLGAAHARMALLLFVGPGVVSFALEPIVFALADRHPRRWFIRAGLGAMAVAAFAAALAPGPVTLAAAVSLAWVASGAATAIGRVTLIDCRPEARGRTLARWELLALVGDLAAPVLLALLASVGASWRTAFAIAGAALAVWCGATVIDPMPEAPRGAADEDEDAGEPGPVARPPRRPRRPGPARLAVRDRAVRPARRVSSWCSRRCTCARTSAPAPPGRPRRSRASSPAARSAWS